MFLTSVFSLSTPHRSLPLSLKAMEKKQTVLFKKWKKVDKVEKRIESNHMRSHSVMLRASQ